MKIERINENQIKCTLNKNDLASRQIKVAELAYGTEKAKLLFRDMMQQAASEFGFHAEDLPLMIEAIPIPGDSIILIITKVEDPEELDTRFSNFSTEDSEEDLMDDYLDEMEELEEEPSDPDAALMDMFHAVRERMENLSSKSKDFVPLSQMLGADKKENGKQENASDYVIRMYSFDNLNTILSFVGLISGYKGISSLYRSNKDNRYYLIMDNTSQSIQEFYHYCGIISEYGTPEEYSSVREAYYKEHFQTIIRQNALQILQNIN